MPHTPVSPDQNGLEGQSGPKSPTYPGFDDWFVSELERHLPALRNRAARLSRGAHQGDDIAQTACLKAWKARASFDPDQDMFAWLCTILKHVWYDELRKVRGRNAYLSPIADDTDIAEPEPRPAGDLIDLRRALSALPPASRELILLRAVLGLSHDEVAALLDMTPVSARKAYSRAVERLRQITAAPNVATGDLAPASEDDLLAEAQALRARLRGRVAA